MNRRLRICYDRKSILWYVVEKQLLNDMRFHKIIMFKHKERCKCIDYIEAKNDRRKV